MCPPKPQNPESDETPVETRAGLDATRSEGMTPIRRDPVGLISSHVLSRPSAHAELACARKLPLPARRKGEIAKETHPRSAGPETRCSCRSWPGTRSRAPPRRESRGRCGGRPPWASPWSWRPWRTSCWCSSCASRRRVWRVDARAELFGTAASILHVALFGGESIAKLTPDSRVTETKPSAKWMTRFSVRFQSRFRVMNWPLSIWQLGESGFGRTIDVRPTRQPWFLRLARPSRAFP